MKVTVIGTGYVGLVSGACFAELGHYVTCYDIDEKKIERLNNGDVSIFEPGLREMIGRAVAAGSLTFTTNVSETIRSTDILFIAVGTPPKNDGSVDMQYVHAVADSIGESLPADAQCVVVTKSTVPVGTAQEVSKRINVGIRKREVTAKFSVVSNPEFLREGSAVHDFLEPDRVVIGYQDDWARKQMEVLYKPFLAKNVPFFWMDTASAEMAKYGANTMLASRISLINEMARLCEATGADIEKVRKVLASDKRIGPHFLQPGIGYGGSCFSKDVRAVVATGKEKGLSLSLLNAVELVNEEQKQYFVQKILDAFHTNVQGKNLAVWGLAYKSNTNDMRSAPSIAVIRRLAGAGATVQAFDPQAVDEARKVFHETIRYAGSAEECLTDADALIVLTEWDEFRNPDWQALRSRMAQPWVFDGRNMFDPAEMEQRGFRYWSIGRRDPRSLDDAEPS